MTICTYVDIYIYAPKNIPRSAVLQYPARSLQLHLSCTPTLTNLHITAQRPAQVLTI